MYLIIFETIKKPDILYASQIHLFSQFFQSLFNQITESKILH